MTTTPKEHIEEIRRSKFSIGGGLNPLTEDLHHAVMHLSAELYTKDVHFLMELIQNAEDNEYSDGVKPSLEFVITSKDITATGAPATLLIFNNEKGFSPKNIDSICSVGRSTKKGNRKRGYIGEKGIGFKSVFLIASQPYIFSNGYKIRFSEQPCAHCNVGYVVPEWVEEKPTLLDLQNIYGSSASLPTTTIVLPLKADKVKPVQQQLSTIHPEILLFLSKIRQLSVREENQDPQHKSVSSISISTEINFVTKKNLQAESYLLNLSADDKGDQSESECSYHMWRQRFPVKSENKVDRRVDVDEWVITLAFPNGERLLRGRTSPGVYAFLPTEMITNFPFIIQADFLLSSSRETILLDNKWNKGILDCVHIAFVNAFTSLVKADAPISSILTMFKFLPIESSPYEGLNVVRSSIKEHLMGENIILSESVTKQKYFHKPTDISRLEPSFWKILGTAKTQGISLHNISSHGRHILSSEFDIAKYSNILCFLGIDYVEDGWYTKCIQSSDMVMRVSDDVYLELLFFISSRWRSSSFSSSIIHTPILKRVYVGGQVILCSIKEVSSGGVCLLRSKSSSSISWLIIWNSVFGYPDNCFFLPQSTQEEIMSKGHTIAEWLEKTVKVETYSVYDYAILVAGAVGSDRKLAVMYAHFLYSSYNQNYLSKDELAHLCGKMPLVNNYGRVIVKPKGVLVPSKGSRWMQLIGSNPWRDEGFVELGEEYLCSCNHAGISTSGKELLNFLKSYVAASDIPELTPPDADLSCFASLLTIENAFLLLDWICNIRRRGLYMPTKFSTSVGQGSWLKVSLLGSAGFGAPSKSFYPSSELNHVVQNGFVDIAFINLKFYGDRISNYKEELKTVGVMFEFAKACEYIGKRLTSLAETGTLSNENVLSILNFIKLLREKFLPPESFIDAVKSGSWMWTSQGYRSPKESVFYGEKWGAASEISNIPFIDQKYYGQELLSFTTELKLLGVIFELSGSYELVVDNLKPHPCYSSVTAKAMLLILHCIHHVKNSSHKLTGALANEKCFKTHMGYKSPAECFLFDPEWSSLMKVFSVFPAIDVAFYGTDISSYKDELHKLGVIVHMEQSVKAFCSVFRKQASSRSIEKENVLKLLGWYKELKKYMPENVQKHILEVKNCINEVKWLKTRLGDYREPKECILHSSDWDPISSISLLPFIDDNYYGKSLYDYKELLQGMGVVTSICRGAGFVASGLRMPENPRSIIAPAIVLLLQCVRYLQSDGSTESKSLLTSFSTKLGQRWVKTSTGYKSPKQCLLFGPDWNKFLQLEDGPFLDEKFYGSLVSYKNELACLEVAVDVKNGCRSIFANLGSNSNFSSIKRIYNCLHHYDWKPTKDDALKVWIPSGDVDGDWVNPENCVLHDRHGLFNEQLHVLEKLYEKNLLSFFSSVFGVKGNPRLDDYCKLWSDWENSGCIISEAECTAFWDFVMKHWSSVTKDVLCDKLFKFPGYADPMEIKLVDKHDILIPDDLCLKDIFKQSTSLPLFVWYPPSLHKMKLNEIFRDIGVRTLSESVQKEEKSVVNNVGLKEVDENQTFITRGLFKLILGFLASPSILLEVEKRHAVIKSLLNAKLYESVEPILLSYKLQLSSGETVHAEMSQIMRWEKSSSMIYVQKSNSLGGRRDLLEYAICASKVISEGLLWEKEEHMLQLEDLLKVAFLLEFDEASIDLLLKTKNLEILPEDEVFLASAFPST